MLDGAVRNITVEIPEVLRCIRLMVKETALMLHISHVFPISFPASKSMLNTGFHNLRLISETEKLLEKDLCPLPSNLRWFSCDIFIENLTKIVWHIWQLAWKGWYGPTNIYIKQDKNNELHSLHEHFLWIPKLQWCTRTGRQDSMVSHETKTTTTTTSTKMYHSEVLIQL